MSETPVQELLPDVPDIGDFVAITKIHRNGTQVSWTGKVRSRNAARRIARFSETPGNLEIELDVSDDWPTVTVDILRPALPTEVGTIVRAYDSNQLSEVVLRLTDDGWQYLHPIALFGRRIFMSEDGMMDALTGLQVLEA
jgi:hypothetical protein